MFCGRGLNVFGKKRSGTDTRTKPLPMIKKPSHHAPSQSGSLGVYADSEIIEDTYLELRTQ